MSRVRENKSSDAEGGVAEDRTTPEFRAMVENAGARGPFGPLFFLTQLAAFVRDHCPDASESLPVIELRLHSAEALRVCHVIGVGPVYVALAVYDEDNANDARAMRTEILPYEAIARVTIRALPPTGPQIGFKVAPAPALIKNAPAMTPAEALHAAVRAPVCRHSSEELEGDDE